MDRSAKAFRRLPAGWGGGQVVGSGFDRDDLERAGAVGADALAAVTSGDNTNILTARIARETFEIPNVVARIYDPRRAQIYLRLGIPTVATVAWTIDQVRRRLLTEASAVEWTDTTGTLSLVELDLPDQLAGRRLSSIDIEGEIHVVGVTRAGVARLGVEGLVGQDGDVLHLMVTTAARDRIGELVTSSSGRSPAAAAPPAAAAVAAPATTPDAAPATSNVGARDGSEPAA